MSMPQLRDFREEDKENDPPEQIESKPAEKPELEQDGEEEVVLVPVKASTFSSSPEKKQSPAKKAPEAKPKQIAGSKQQPEKRKPIE